MVEIVKVQRPLDGPENPWLVYAKGKSRINLIAPDDVLRADLGDDPRGYFEAEWADGLWRVGRRVEDQPW